MNVTSHQIYFSAKTLPSATGRTFVHLYEARNITGGSTPEEILMERERHNFVKRTLRDGLPDAKPSTKLMLRQYIAGKPIREIAKQSGANYSSIKTRIERIADRMLTRLNAHSQTY
jgi:hypothetical protein